MEWGQLSKAIESSADPQRAKSFIEALEKSSAGIHIQNAGGEPMRILCALLSGSQASGEALVAHPEWLEPLLKPDFLSHSHHFSELRRDVEAWLAPCLEKSDHAAALAKLREFKQREWLRIAARDLGRLAPTEKIIQELSDVTDVCLDAVLRICWQQLTRRLGTPFHLDPDNQWHQTEFAVVGLGKLGGQELNYSSDIDVVFVYSAEGSVFKAPPRRGEQNGKGLSNHAFFRRLSEALIYEISRMTPDGSLFRIDLRLRPEGNSGPLARSLESYENYYAQWGQTWERMMLMKARFCAGNAELGAEFIEMVNSFRYPRAIGNRTLREVSAMKKRIENEVVKAGEIDRNVKLGRGGIREIEFVTQTLQLLHGGHVPFVQGAQTVAVLKKMVQYRLLSQEEAHALVQSYYFLRDIEHRLQMDNHQQTHTIPEDRNAFERLSWLMGFDSTDAFDTKRARCSANVRQMYRKILPETTLDGSDGMPELSEDNQEQWKQFLAAHSFRDVVQALRMVSAFVNGPGYVHVSPRTTELARDLLPKFFALCPKSGMADFLEQEFLPHNVLSDPDRVLVRLDSFISAYGARSALYELWTQHPKVFELLLLLFDRSEFLAETAIRDPDLVDDLEISGRLRRAKTSAEILRDLRFGLQDEDQKRWIRRYHQAEQMRIGLRDILGLSDFEQSLIEISALADACLQYALEVVMKEHRLKKSPFCIIGLGKLGGCEVNYGSDLDVMFVTSSSAKTLPRLQSLAVEVMDLLSAKTEQGAVFKTDARLRPHGGKGLLVNSFKAFEEYYRRRASLWEIQTITRLRLIAGDMVAGEKFRKLASVLSNFKAENVARQFLSDSGQSGLAAYTPDWKSQIVRMRERIENERTPAGKNDFAIKTGSGGLMDAEFLAQIFCLESGWQEPNTGKALERACDSGVIPSEKGKALLANYRQLLRVECILRRWSFEGEVLLPEGPEPLTRVAVRCGYPDADAFMRVVAGMRTIIHSVWKEVIECVA